jgi:hypothetical protein
MGTENSMPFKIQPLQTEQPIFSAFQSFNSFDVTDSTGTFTIPTTSTFNQPVVSANPEPVTSQQSIIFDDSFFDEFLTTDFGVINNNQPQLMTSNLSMMDTQTGFLDSTQAYNNNNNNNTLVSNEMTEGGSVYYSELKTVNTFDLSNPFDEVNKQVESVNNQTTSEALFGQETMNGSSQSVYSAFSESGRSGIVIQKAQTTQVSQLTSNVDLASKTRVSANENSISLKNNPKDENLKTSFLPWEIKNKSSKLKF